MQYIVLDLEWNQPFNREMLVKEPVILQGEIVQIGAVKLDSELRTVDIFKMMVRPSHYRVMNRKVKELTGIKTSDIKRSPDFPTVFAKFKKWCGEDYALVTWGCDDIPMLKNNMALHSLFLEPFPPHYDAQLIYSHQTVKEKRQFSLAYAMEYFDEIPFEAHDALNDALSTAAILRHLDLENGIENYDDVTRGPKLPTVKKTFESFSALINDEEVNTLVCPSCRSILRCEEWVSYRRGKLSGITDCSCGGKYIARLACTKSKDGSFRVGRKISERSAEDEAYYYFKRRANAERKKKTTV